MIAWVLRKLEFLGKMLIFLKKLHFDLKFWFWRKMVVFMKNYIFDLVRCDRSIWYVLIYWPWLKLGLSRKMINRTKNRFGAKISFRLEYPFLASALFKIFITEFSQKWWENFDNFRKFENSWLQTIIPKIAEIIR